VREVTGLVSVAVVLRGVAVVLQLFGDGAIVEALQMSCHSPSPRKHLEREGGMEGESLGHKVDRQPNTAYALGLVFTKSLRVGVLI
jgi:hypothetical protein